MNILQEHLNDGCIYFKAHVNGFGHFRNLSPNEVYFSSLNSNDQKS